MIIEAKQIRKSFGALEVLKGVDFSAQKAEVVSIMGASGAGKTTLLQILGTLSSPDSGQLVIDGEDALNLSEKELAGFRSRKIGFVFQAHHLLPEFTALENVMIPAMILNDSLPKSQRKSAAAMRQKAESLLEKVGLKDRMSHRPSQLSGGEQQRVAIARALVNDPAVVLADEPTGNLDSATKAQIHKLLFELRDALGQTIIIVTHDPELAAMCDRSLVMKDGEFSL